MGRSENKTTHRSWVLIALLVLTLSLLGCDGNSNTAPDNESATLTQETDVGTATAEPTSTAPPEPSATPTATATATVPPSPTPDPDLAAWTILVYMAGDNNLATAALANLNQMEAAGASDKVQLIVQADLPLATGDTNTTRYQITADNDLQTVSSTIVAELGESNMGSPDTLSNFLSWGMSNYPAQRYGLVLWNHGIGWNGIAFDDSAGDQLTMPELAEGLDQGLDGRQLDFVGFDACLMGQLDVYAALAPYAQTAVASEELTPAQGWPYTRWLESLYAEPNSGGQAIAQTLTTEFISLYENELSNEFITLSAVDLTKIGQVTTSLEGLATELEADLSVSAGTIGNARSGTETFAQAYGIAADRYSAIDLAHFSQILGEQALNTAVAEQAAELHTAIESAVIDSPHGRGLKQANGIALYFPRNGRVYDASYTQNGVLAGWSSFLEAYYAHGEGVATPPQISIAPTAPDEPVGLLQPAHINFQISGRDLSQVALLAGVYEVNGAGERSGRRLLLEYDWLIPEPTYLRDGSKIYSWQDGLHEDFYIWSTRATYLTDGNNGQFVVMWPAQTKGGDALKQRTIQGEYTRAGEDDAIPANLVFDQTTGSLAAVWGTPAGRNTPFELTPRSGDTFQADAFYIEENGSFTTAVGLPLTFDEAGRLSYEWRPLPSDQYFLGIEAETSAGFKSGTTTDFVVQNDDVDATNRAYLDPYLGFQFTYPADWYRPVYQNSSLFTTDRTGQTRLQITIYDKVIGATSTTLKQESLAAFGDIDILYEDQIVLAERTGERTAYGYSSPDGERTGQFVTLVRDNVGYVIDIDGPTAVETDTLKTITTLLDSWAFRPLGTGLFPNTWETIELVDFSVPQRSDFRYQPADGGWERFIADADPQIFVALRVDDADGLPLAEVVTKWSAIASKGVAAYDSSEVGQFALAGQLWWRQDFSYNTENGDEIWGFLLVRKENGQHIVGWAEAPAAVYPELEPTIFEVMLADFVQKE